MPNPNTQNRLANDLDEILSQTIPFWEELRGKRLFITGGTGFFGCWLLESFAWANAKLNLGATAVVLTRNPEAFQIKAPHLACCPAIQFHKGDVTSFDFPEGEFAYVIHAATESTVQLNLENPLRIFDTIIAGTRRTLDFAVQSRAKGFLLTSSGAVYGRQPSDVTHITEEYEGGPNVTEARWVYGEAKRAAEMLCTLYSNKHGLKTTIARCFAFVGPYLPLDAHFAIGNFIRDGILGKSIQISGDGTPYRSYLYAADLVVWLLTVLHRGQSCRPYNVGSEEDLSIARVAESVAGCFQPAMEVRIAKASILGKVPERYVPSTSRATRELGLTPKIGLQQAIQRTIIWERCR